MGFFCNGTRDLTPRPSLDVTGQGTITLDLNASDPSVFSMSLYSPSGTLLDTAASSIVYEATETGSYKIRVYNNASKVKPLNFDLTATYPVVQ